MRPPTLLASLLALALGACGGATPRPGDTPAAHGDHAAHDGHASSGHDPHHGHDAHAHHQAAPPAAEPLPGASLYRVDASFTDQDGDAVRLADLAGRPAHVALVYTHCAAVCPRIVSDMTRIEDGLGADADGVRFVLVSIDPERDTPERLRAFAEERQLDPARWTLLRGEDRDVRKIAAALGVQYRAIGEGDFAHSNLVTLLDAGGVVTHRQEGLGVEPGPAVDATRRLLVR